MRIKLIISIFLAIALTVKGQQFVEKTHSIIGLQYAACVLGDIDNDNDLDIIVSGKDASGDAQTKIYRNDGNFVFVEITSNLPNVFWPHLFFSDVDNDNDIDLFLEGTDDSNNLFKVFKNENDNFIDMGIEFNHHSVYSFDNGDYNNDGLSDIIFQDYYSSERKSELLIFNLTNDTNFINSDIYIDNIAFGTVTWGDYNNDDYLDIFATGIRNDFEVCKIFSNNGNNSFSELPISLFGLQSKAIWCDINSDGFLDIAYTGVEIGGMTYFKLYKNLGEGNFELINTTITGTGDGVLAGDGNNDGETDLLLTGNSTKYYTNNGDDSFSLTQDFGTSSNGAFTWGDLDNDGDLDILLLRNILGSLSCSLYENTVTALNNKPTVPTGLNTNTLNDSVTILYWNRSSDIETVNSGLSYNVYMGTEPSQTNIISPLSELSTGYRKIVDLGNAGTDTSMLIKHLNPGAYFWSVQCIDNSYYSSEFASETSFVIKPTSDFLTVDSLCHGDTISVTYIGNTDINQTANYHWDFDGAEIIEGTNRGSYKIYWNSTGTKEISLYINVDTIVSETTTKQVVISEIPTSDFIVDTLKLCDLDTVLISYTGTATSNGIFNWDFDYGNLISDSGEGDYEINWNSPGFKTVSLSVEENGCTSILSAQNVSVYQPNSSFQFDEFVCDKQNSNILFTGSASDSAAFEWNFDGANIVTGSVEGPYIVNWDGYGDKNVSLRIDDNGCFSNLNVQIIRHNPSPTPTFSSPVEVCYNNIANIEYIGSASDLAYFNWDFGEGIIMSGSGIGPYEVLWNNSGNKQISLLVTENGCSADTNTFITVNPQTQPISICMVGVDSLNHNMIVWEQQQNTPYDTIYVYKETSHTDIFEKIGKQPADSLSVFIDTLSNPSQNSNRYKISVLDSCGYETPQSDPHKTLHLTISSGIGGAWNLIWDNYEGFDYSTYNIYRGTSANSLLKIAEQASNTFTYTDLTPPVGTVYYQLEILNPDPCTVSNLKTEKDYYGSTRSNIVSSDQLNSINNLSRSGIIIYPNPASGRLYINTGKSSMNYKISIFSVDGKLLLSHQSAEQITEIDISDLNSGIYVLSLDIKNRLFKTKFIKR